MKCEQHNCDKEATDVVYWPNQVTKQCCNHTKQAVALGKIMGIDVPTVAIQKVDNADSKCKL
jgi:hypothetical protein